MVGDEGTALFERGTGEGEGDFGCAFATNEGEPDRSAVCDCCAAE